jgi:DNA end-binding protein Ku
MAARAIWNGVLRAGTLSVPVQLFSAAQDRGVAFHLLHAKDRTRVQQKMVRADSGEPVGKDEIRRGVEVDPGVFVFVSAEEAEALKPEASRDVTVLRVVPTGTVPAPALDRPYWLGPHGDSAAERARYFALAQALAEDGRETVVSWTMRDRAYRGVLRERDGYLVLHTLRLGARVVRPGELEPPGGERIAANERAMARQLVEALSGSFDPSEYHDTFRAKVEELIEAKAGGKRTTVRKLRPRKAPSRDLSGLLEASLRHAGKSQGKKSKSA